MLGFKIVMNFKTSSYKPGAGDIFETWIFPSSYIAKK